MRLWIGHLWSRAVLGFCPAQGPSISGQDPIMPGPGWPDACSWVAEDMKSRSLLAQVLAVNLLLVAATMLLATVALHQHVAGFTENRELMVLGLAVLATMLADWILLRRRFMPLDQLIRAMEQLD